jgi:isopenicillin N synthase-like dioxygenase
MDGVPGRVLPGRRTGPVGAQTALARGELPCFDLSCFATGAEGSPARESLAGALDEALSRTGFFLVTGHGIEPGVRRAMFAAAAAFFAEPLEVKRRLAIGNSPAHRGYVGIGAESLDDTGRGDAKESLDTGGEQGPDHPEVVAGTPLFGPNQWPRTPGFREAWERYFAQAVEAAARVQRALAHALGLTDDDILAPPGGETMYHLRFIHYPSQRAQPLAPGQLGSGVHTDYGSVTLLADDGVGGLQVMTREGTWLEVGVPEDALVVNLGDLMAIWTNDRWVSNPHRVVNPEDTDRYSIPLFVTPPFNAVISCIGTCLGPGEGPRYRPQKAGDYLLSRLDSTHTYRNPLLRGN